MRRIRPVAILVVVFSFVFYSVGALPSYVICDWCQHFFAGLLDVSITFAKQGAAATGGQSNSDVRQLRALLPLGVAAHIPVSTSLVLCWLALGVTARSIGRNRVATARVHGHGVATGCAVMLPMGALPEPRWGLGWRGLIERGAPFARHVCAATAGEDAFC